MPPTGSTATPPKYQVLPDLPPEEFEALQEDIRRRGVQLPVEVTTEDEILDGHQRLRACEQLGIRDYPVKVVAGLQNDLEKRHHAIRANLLRRQLSREQRRTLIADELVRTKGKLSNRVLAGLFGCSDHTIASVRRELESGAQLRTWTGAEGKDGKSYPARRPTSIMVPNPREARAAQERLIYLGDEAPETTISLNRARKLGYRKERADLLEAGKHVRITDDQIKLVHADFRNVKLKEKCDLIFCDPPYSKEYIPLYGDLGAWAKANLKPGGYLACYAGHYHLPDVLDQLRRHLDYVWTFVVIHKGFYDAKVVHPHRILATWKPVLLFSNGKPAAPHPTMRDVFISGRSKDHLPARAAGGGCGFLRRLPDPARRPRGGPVLRLGDLRVCRGPAGRAAIHGLRPGQEGHRHCEAQDCGRDQDPEALRAVRTDGVGEPGRGLVMDRVQKLDLMNFRTLNARRLRAFTVQR